MTFPSPSVGARSCSGLRAKELRTLPVRSLVVVLPVMLMASGFLQGLSISGPRPAIASSTIGQLAPEDCARAAAITAGASLAHPCTAGRHSSPVVSGSDMNWTSISALSTATPPARCCSAMAYDAFDGYEVLFGGVGACGGVCNDTWILRGSQWTHLDPSHAPSPRDWASMAYDPFDRAVLLFGGTPDGNIALADTWSFSSGVWTQLDPSTAPPGRWASGLSMDPQDGYMVLFGGYQGGSSFLQDTWTFVNGTWSEVLTAHLPPPRWTPLLAFDDQEEGVLLFGGYAYTLGFLGDTWVYAKGDWSQVGAGSAPPARDKGMMAYDAWDQRMVLFAGEFCLLSCSTGGYVRHLNDTWSFENGTWKNISGSRNPPQQCCGAMTFDWGSGQLVVLSANSSGGRNATTWVGSLSPPSTGGPEISSLRAWPSSPTVGSGVLLTVAARPSLGTLTYLYTSLPPGCATLDSPLLACAPRQPGSYVVSVEVTDASGRTVAGTLALTVTLGGASPPPPSPVPGYLTWVVAGGMVFSAVVVLLWVRAGRKRTTGAPSPREPPDSTRGASEAKEPIVPEHTLDKGSTTLRHGPEDPRSPEPSSTEEVAGPRDPPQGREASAPVEAGRPPTE